MQDLTINRIIDNNESSIKQDSNTQDEKDWDTLVERTGIEKAAEDIVPTEKMFQEKQDKQHVESKKKQKEAIKE
eukprot:715393-Ditylum_brightwellii.AAC.1